MNISSRAANVVEPAFKLIFSSSCPTPCGVDRYQPRALSHARKPVSFYADDVAGASSVTKYPAATSASSAARDAAAGGPSCRAHAALT
ncbi:hypothetical protein, partial [Burkholderia cenocepacia]|uniref:hypothetical protein n=1 Tax=Burkholderia cenocepacia TaxID=95486 RepID=UPI001872E2ED